MKNVNRRTFAKLAGAAVATAVEPLLAADLAASPTSGSSNRARPGRTQRSPVGQDNGLQSIFLMDIVLETEHPHSIETPGCGRFIVPVSGGSFDGPRLKGTVVSPGGDWMIVRPDGSRVLDVRIVLQTDDAQTISVSWRGVAFTQPGGQLVARILPLFETGAPTYAWLNNVVAVGVYRGTGIAYRVYQIS